MHTWLHAQHFAVLVVLQHLEFYRDMLVACRGVVWGAWRSPSYGCASDRLIFKSQAFPGSAHSCALHSGRKSSVSPTQVGCAGFMRG